MNDGIPKVDELSRAAKALMDSGLVAGFGDAGEILAATVPTIVLGADADSYSHQAALLTAVETTARAFDQAPVHLASSLHDRACRVPGMYDLTLAEAIVEAGGHFVRPDALMHSSRPVIGIGTVTPTSALTLQVTWDHWVAHVDTTGRRLPERGNMILAPAAAAALAVTECFKRALGADEACYRRRSLNIWRPGEALSSDHASLGEDTLGPELRRLPRSAWLVGLGHLGQGFAWCWRLLPYANPNECELLLQDFDTVKIANRSTGMLIRAEDVGIMKSRVVAAVLERAGFSTRIVERRLLPDTRRFSKEPELALVGVDKPEPRRIISDIGWTFTVDVGLGAGPMDFSDISIHTFPSPTSSHDVLAWQSDSSADRARRAKRQEAYQNAEADGADECGLVQLAETAVAAPFVGVLAGCLALAEPLRLLHGQNPHLTLTYNSGRTTTPRATRAHGSPRLGFLEISPAEHE